ncbi:MAG: hypothetical protein JWP81_1245 [Ferruginibacter sp.]|nr:hypothetical protein [Ferruginibacter sp.]
MNRLILSIAFSFNIIFPVMAQDMVGKANAFIRQLDDAQRVKALYPFDTTERYRFNYVPLDDRKGISVNELNATQRAALMDLLKTCLSEQTLKKVNDIMQLDNILKELEHRKAEDHYRDPGKYFITIFGIPSSSTIWGWRFEGHHVAFHFSADKNQLVAGTPGFLGANPAIVLSGPQKNKEVLKEETDRGFTLLHALSPEELKKAITDTIAPGEIVTGASRSAMIGHPVGIRYNELSAAHQQLLLQLLNGYIHRYTTLFAQAMLKEIQAAGLENLWFTWAGSTEHVLGKPYYYRIQGPTIIIEYDNSQNNANHIHTVIRDLKNDFGGDLLLEHYRKSH